MLNREPNDARVGEEYIVRQVSRLETPSFIMINLSGESKLPLIIDIRSDELEHLLLHVIQK